MFREIVVNMRRTVEADCEKNGFEMKGFAFFWPDGSQMKTGLTSFCEKGMQLFFGKNAEIPEQCKVRLLCRDAEEKEPFWRPEPDIRARRMFIKREGSQGILYFHNGNRTELAFDENVDEQAVLDWIGLSDLKEEVRWLDLAAVPVKDEPLTTDLAPAV